MDSARIPKSHLQLLRVRIDIHLGRIEIQIEHVGAKTAVKQHVLVGEAGGACNQLVAHEAAVEISELQIGLAARECRQGRPP